MIVKNARDLKMDLRGFQMSYDDLGDSVVPLIFIHGFPFDKSTWAEQMNLLKGKMRVIAPDLRGFGKSGKTEEAFSIGLFADDVLALMDKLEIKKAVLCGFSMGGYIALNLMGRAHERFAGLILCDTQCIADTDAGREKRMKSIAQIEAGGIKEFADGFVKAVFCEASLRDKTEIVENIRRIILSTDASTITSTLLALAKRNETCSVLSSVKIPCMILCGEEDAVTVPAQSEFMHKHIPHSVFHLIPQAGHMSNLEQTAIFNGHLLHFMDKLLTKK